jgi:hypothetical protein
MLLIIIFILLNRIKSVNLASFFFDFIKLIKGKKKSPSIPCKLISTNSRVTSHFIL